MIGTRYRYKIIILLVLVLLFSSAFIMPIEDGKNDEEYIDIEDIYDVYGFDYYIEEGVGDDEFAIRVIVINNHDTSDDEQHRLEDGGCILFLEHDWKITTRYGPLVYSTAPSVSLQVIAA